MRAKSLSSVVGYEAKEQKTKNGNGNKNKNSNLQDRNRFYGMLEEKMLPLAGDELLKVFKENGAIAARDFYLFLHEETKLYLQKNPTYSMYVKAMQFASM